jgi:hypothetical protein
VPDLCALLAGPLDLLVDLGQRGVGHTPTNAAAAVGIPQS